MSKLGGKAMSDFDYAIKFVLKNEGGYSDHPNDRGGATNFGITQATLARYLKRPVSKADVKEMSFDLAKDIYKAFYWNPLALDQVEDKVLATAIFDQGVNFGIGAAAKRIQKILKVTVDGFIGIKTLKAINDSDARELAITFIKESQLSYAYIVRRNKSQTVFLVGWLRRTHELFDLVL